MKKVKKPSHRVMTNLELECGSSKYLSEWLDLIILLTPNIGDSVKELKLPSYFSGKVKLYNHFGKFRQTQNCAGWMKSDKDDDILYNSLVILVKWVSSKLPY